MQIPVKQEDLSSVEQATLKNTLVVVVDGGGPEGRAEGW